MKTIKQLKEQLAVERAMTSLHRESNKRHSERKELESEIKRIQRERKPVHHISQTIYNAARGVGKNTATALKARVIAIQKQQRREMKSKSNPWATNF